MQINRIALVAASAALTACASTQASTTTATPAASASTQTGATTAKPKTDPKATRITASEAMALNVPTAYEVVDRLHRQWFRHIAGEGTLTPIVYVNNQKQDGGLEALKLVPAGDIIYIDYSKASEAQMKYGPDAKGGAIIVTRR